MTYPSAPPANNAYPSFPLAIKIAVNITAGNLASAGNFVLTYTGSSGANTLTGTLAIPARGITLTLNITLSDSLQVGGSMTVAENGATINIGSLAGNLLGTITGNVTVAPNGWTGTMSISLLTGAYSVNLNTGTGNSTALLNSSGNLVVGFADGTGDTITNPINAPLASGNGTVGGGGGGGGGGGSFNTPVSLPGGNPQSINASGQMVGGSGSPGFHAVFWPSPSAAAQTLAVPQGATTSEAFGVNASGQIVGRYITQSGNSIGLFWSSPTAQPATLQPLPGDVESSAVAINTSGQIVGTSRSSGASDPLHAAFWASSTVTPQPLPALSGETAAEAIGINDGGTIIGNSPPSAAGPKGIVWTAPGPGGQAGAPTLLAALTGDTSTSPRAINAGGQIVGTSFGSNRVGGVFWSNPTAQPQSLPSLPGDGASIAWDINNGGTISGASESTGFVNRATIWKSLQPTAVNTLLPSGSGWNLEQGIHINAAGVILGTGKKPDGTEVNFETTPQ
jgi:hypothetical protein